MRIFALLLLVLVASCANTNNHKVLGAKYSCGENVPTGFISIDGVRQESRIGGAFWNGGWREPDSGWPSASEPLKTRYKVVIGVELPPVSPMTHLEYMIKKVDESVRSRPDATYLSKLSASDRQTVLSFYDKTTLWNIDVSDVKVIAPLAKQRLTLDLEPGQYLITMFGWWKECGDATHGFLIRVDK